MRLRNGIIAILCVAAVATAHAQWLNYPAAGIPRTKDGKPDLAAPLPRANGKPDFSGVWTTDGTGRAEMDRLFPGLSDFAVPGDDPATFPKYFLNVFADYKNEDVPIKPEALQISLARFKNAGKDNPTSHCLPAGIPMGDLLPTPRRFIHLPNMLVILYEGVNPQRMIYLDGRKHVIEQPSWLGYSVGRWEGDTLVVDTRGFNDRSWLDAFGHPHTEALHVVERITRKDFGHMEVQMTFEDPGAYTKPFSFRFTQTLTPDTDVIEYVCAENEKDRQHLDHH
ncbi:MAG TPA: hypothetical protein VFB92_13305 [Vicinamibacterales bacterium]|jgi:hypothetical protein|nr:hypothetical protein [Vicinamibacterales bacterium]